MTDCAFVCSLPGADIDIYWFAGLARPFPPHVHEKALLGCLARGARFLRLPGQDLLAVADDLIYIPPFTTHGCAAAQPAPAQWLGMQLPFELLDIAKPAILHSQVLCRQLRLVASLTRRQMQAESLLKFLSVLKPKLQDAALPDKAATVSDAFSRLNAWLRAVLPAKVTLAEMAKHCQLKKFAFLRTFQRAYGITPYRYLQSLRLVKAQQLLREGESLAQCAASSGFYDQAHLNRIFKASIGITPGAWQRAGIWS